jgi:proline iminopeptidase
MIFFDLRNRGRSQSISSAAKLEKGIVNDIKDLEAIRQHFQVEKFTLVGHGYLGLVAALYAKQYPEALEGIIQISPVSPTANKSYSGADAFSDSLTIKLNNSFEQLAASKETLSPKDYCDRYWSLMRTMYQGDGIGAERIARGVCRYPNEHPDKLQTYLNDFVIPSINAVVVRKADFDAVDAPVLAIHGTNDRVNPLGASKDWVAMFPNAELLRVENGGHMPWIEAEAQVFNAIREFVR